MDELFKNAPEIIKAAATNPLALAALIILTLGVLGFVHFRKSSEMTRVVVFVLTGFALLVVFGLVLIGAIVEAELKQSVVDSDRSVPPVADVATAPPPPPATTTPVSNTLASTCVTESGSCPLVFPEQLPRGSICSCFSLWGEFRGVAQ